MILLEEMQLYHHPFSLESQKVRLALEEKGVDYSSIHVNPLKGKNLDLDFFRMNATGKLPVFKNADFILFDTISIIQYIDSINLPLGGSVVDHNKVLRWMKKIDRWDTKIFTLTHVPKKYIVFFSRFKRRVTVTRMSQGPDLASKYHLKLRDGYATEELLKNTDAITSSKEILIDILDDAESHLSTSSYLAGHEFSMADVMFVPILARLELLGLANEYITPRDNVAEYWSRVKTRKSYKAVIGKYFSAWRKYRIFCNTYITVWVRSLLRRY